MKQYLVDAFTDRPFSGNPAAVSAGIAALGILESATELYEQLDEKGAKLEKTLAESGFNVNRVGSLLTVFFTERSVTDYDTAKTSDTNKYAKFYYS